MNKCEWGFTPKADCENCFGTGYFIPAGSMEEVPEGEACAFCLEDAILAGEIDGTINDDEYVEGRHAGRIYQA